MRELETHTQKETHTCNFTYSFQKSTYMANHVLSFLNSQRLESK